MATHFNCPTEFALAVLDGKWKSSILCCLRQNPCRYTQLRAALSGLSDKMLSERLRELLDAGLVTRQGPSGGVQTYALSPLGRSLDELLTVLSEWALAHADAFGVEINGGLKPPLASAPDACLRISAGRFAHRC
jgi:DNA-binding HxlR family transcriptional regulator